VGQIAWRGILSSAREMGMTIRDYITHGPDPMGVAVLMEDGAAVLGLGMAGTCLGLTAWTGNHVWDAVGSISVGTLLGAVAIFLIRKNKDALLGRAIHPDRMARILSVLKNNPAISSVHDVKAVTLGLGNVRFKAELKFNSYVLAERFLKAQRFNLQQQWRQARTEHDMRMFLQQYSAGMMNFLGEEIDRIEAAIKKEVPEVRHVDLELV